MPDLPDYDEPPECPACDGAANYLGRLGDRLHFRCCMCGLDFSVPIQEEGV